MLERVDVVTEHDDLVISPLVVLDQELRGSELVRIHHAQEHLLHGAQRQVFPVELGRHLAPNFSTLDSSDEAFLLQFQPIGLVEFRSDQEIEVGDLVVLSNKSGGEAELAVGSHLRQDASKHLGWNGVDFVKHHDAPVLLLDPLHRLFGFPGSPLSVSDHVEGGDENGAAHRLVLGIGSEATDGGIVGSGPHLELLLPLFHRDATVAEHNCKAT